MIDPTIALQYRPVEMPDLAQMAQNTLSLKAMAQQGQLRDQQIQGAQMENQQRQQDLADQQSMRRAYMDANGDLDQMKSLAVKYGASPKALMALQSSIIDQKTKLAGLDKDTLANHQAQNDQLAGLLAPIAAETDPVKQQAMWNAGQQEALRRQILTPQDVAAHPYPGVDGVKNYVASLKSQDQLIKEASANAAQTSANARQTDAAINVDKWATDKPGAVAKSQSQQMTTAAQQLGAVRDQASYQRIWNELPAGVARQFPAPEAWTPQTPQAVLQAGMTPDQQVTTGQTAVREARTARHESVMENQGAGRLNLEANRYNQQYGDPTADASPAEIQRAKLIANGDIPAPTTRAKGYERTMALVMASDPTYTESRYIGKKQFKTGKDADNIVSVTTILDHLDNAEKNSAALGFSPTQSLNITPLQHRYHEDTDFLTGEVGKLIKNGVVSEGEANRMISGLTSSLQGNRDAAIDELKNLMAGKFEGIRQKYKNSTGQELPVSMFDPATQQRITKRGLLGDSGASAAPSGNSHGIPELGSTFNGGKVLKVTKVQ